MFNGVLLKLTLLYLIEHDEGENSSDISTGMEREFLESPIMTDGTIEEDFEDALAKKVATAGVLGSPETPVVHSKIFPG